ncbi:MAG TPA: Uma2 family endonuclease [Thermoanaerobaculia bacterium]|nr:Uma2 family endonuclease [Thermoanaerobaculia bacterium]
MATEPLRPMTVEEYLAFERSSEEKHELRNGEMFAMGGASPAHAAIVLNAAAELRNQLKGRPCQAYVSDLRVLISATGLYTYPDVVVVCGETRFEKREGLETLLNPTLIIEVLSPSTADYDRAGKFEHYRSLPSLQEYLVLAQDRVMAEHFVRQGDDAWLLTETRDPAATLDLPSIGCRLAMAEVYEKAFEGAGAGS